MTPFTRYQAAILRHDHILLLKVWDHAFSGQTFWIIPGGGRQPDETEEDCVKREVHEETQLQVEIERLILDEPVPPNGPYQRAKTYACRIISGEPEPGFEPEVDTATKTTILQVGWFDLREPTTWDPLVLEDPFTAPLLQRLRVALGYAAAGDVA